MEGGEEGGSPGRHGCVSAEMSSWLLQMSCSSAHAGQRLLLSAHGCVTVPVTCSQGRFHLEL